MSRNSSSANVSAKPDDFLDRRLQTIETARRNAESWRREGRFRPILILLVLLAIVSIGVGTAAYYWRVFEAEKRERQTAMEWKREAIEGQFRHIISGADKALNEGKRETLNQGKREGKRDFARAMVLAGRELAAAEDAGVVAGPFYTDALLSSLQSGTRELVVLRGEQVSKPVFADYSGDNKVIAWTSAKGERTVTLTDTSSGGLLRRIRRESEKVQRLALAPNGLHIAVLSANREIELIDAAGSLESRRSLLLASEPIIEIAFGETAQGTVLVGLDAGGELWVWRITQGIDRVEPVPVLARKKEKNVALESPRDGEQVVAAISCARTRCATLGPDRRLSVYNVDEAVRLLASRQIESTEVERLGNKKFAIVVADDFVLLKSGDRWSLYLVQESDGSLAQVNANFADESFWPLVQSSDSSKVLAIEKSEERNRLVSLSLSSPIGYSRDAGRDSASGMQDNPSSRRRAEFVASFDAGEVIAVSRDGSSLLLLQSGGGNDHLRIVRLEAFRSVACGDDCPTGIVSASKRGDVYAASKNAIYRLDPRTHRFMAVIDDVRGLIHKTSSGGGRSSKIDQDAIELLAAEPDPELDRLYVLFEVRVRDPSRDDSAQSRDRPSFDDSQVIAQSRDRPSLSYQLVIFDLAQGTIVGEPRELSSPALSGLDYEIDFKRIWSQARANLPDIAGWNGFLVSPDAPDDPEKPSEPNVLIWRTPNGEKTTETIIPPDPNRKTKIKLLGSSALILNKEKELLEIISFSPLRRDLAVPSEYTTRARITLSGRARDVADLGFLGSESQIFIVHQRGTIDIWDISQLESRSHSIDTRAREIKVYWSPSFQQFATVGSDNTVVKLFNTDSGKLLRIYEHHDPIEDLQILQSGETLILSRDSYTILPPATEFRDEAQLSQFARAITPRWFLRSNIDKEGLLILSMRRGMRSTGSVGTPVAECKIPDPDQSPIFRTVGAEGIADVPTRRPFDFAEVCTTFYRSSYPAGLKALVIAQLGRVLAIKRGDRTDSVLLPYEIARVGFGDPVAMALVGERILNRVNRETNEICKSSALVRRLFETAILNGGFVAPSYFTIALACIGSQGIEFPEEIVQRLSALAASGDPMAHAAIGLVHERKGQLETALAHYLAASFVLHDLKGQLVEHHIEQVAAVWEDMEQKLGLRRGTVAQLLDRDTILAAVENAEKMAQRSGQGQRSLEFASLQTISNHAAAWTQPNFAADVSKGEQKLREIADGTSQEPLIKLVIESRYQIATRLVDGSGVEIKDQNTRLRTSLLEILRMATELPDADPLTVAAFAPVLKIAETEPDSSLIPTLARHALHALAKTTALPIGDEQQKLLLRGLTDVALRHGDRKSVARLALMILSIEEKKAWDTKRWQDLAKAQKKALESLSGEADLSDYRLQLAALQWTYLGHVAYSLLSSYESTDSPNPLATETADLARQILADGLTALHARTEEIIEDDRQKLTTLALVFGMAGVEAGKRGRLEEQARYHEKAVRLGQALIRLSKGDGSHWGNLAIAQHNVAWNRERQAERQTVSVALAAPVLEEALRLRQMGVESSRMAKKLGYNNGAKALFNSLMNLAEAYDRLDRTEDSLFAALGAYQSLSAADRKSLSAADQKANTTFLKSDSSWVGYAIASLYRKNRIAREPVADAEPCDIFAGHFGDPSLPASGQDFERMEGDVALDACEKAVTRTPNNPRFVYQRARALHKKGDEDAALRGYRAAAAAGSVIALNAIVNLRPGSEAGPTEVEYFNQVVRCCGREVAEHLLDNSKSDDRSKIRPAAAQIITWAAELGDGAAHEKIAGLLPDDEWISLLRESESGEADRNALAYVHLGIARRIYAMDRRDDDDRRVSSMLTELSSKLSPADRIKLEGKIAAWHQKAWRDVPSWMFTPPPPPDASARR
jgi:WD40 repeat protein/tetratricopeptide (TPR) repeat protein